MNLSIFLNIFNHLYKIFEPVNKISWWAINKEQTINNLCIDWLTSKWIFLQYNLNVFLCPRTQISKACYQSIRGAIPILLPSFRIFCKKIFTNLRIWKYNVILNGKKLKLHIIKLFIIIGDRRYTSQICYTKKEHRLNLQILTYIQNFHQWCPK